MDKFSKIKIFLVEGADGVGKSTYCNQLARDYYGLIHHVDGKFPNTLNEYVFLINDLINKAKNNGRLAIIFDRGWIGELVYGPKYRGTSRITREEIRTIELYIAKQNCELINTLIYNHPETILNVYKTRGETIAEHDLKAIEDIQEAFKKEFFKTCNNFTCIKTF